MHRDTARPLRERLQRDLAGAMRARDAAAVAAIRSALTAIANAELPRGPHEPAPVVGRSGDVAPRPLSEEDVRAAVQVEVDERRTAAGTYAGLGQDGVAERLHAEIAVLSSYLSEAAPRR